MHPNFPFTVFCIAGTKATDIAQFNFIDLAKEYSDYLWSKEKNCYYDVYVKGDRKPIHQSPSSLERIEIEDKREQARQAAQKDRERIKKHGLGSLLA